MRAGRVESVADEEKSEGGEEEEREWIDYCFANRNLFIPPLLRIFPSSLPRVSLVLDAVGPRLLVVESRIAGEIERVLPLVEK